MTTGYYDGSYPPSVFAKPATGATAGTPGTFTPAGSRPPATVAKMAGIIASPTTAWTSGQYVQTGTAGAAGRSSWSGTSWVGGAAPLAAKSSDPDPLPQEAEPVTVKVKARPKRKEEE